MCHMSNSFHYGTYAKMIWILPCCVIQFYLDPFLMACCDNFFNENALLSKVCAIVVCLASSSVIIDCLVPFSNLAA